MSWAGLANLLHAERFPWHTAFAAVQMFLFLLSDQCLCIVKNVCVCVCVYIYIHTYIYIYTHTHTHTSDCVDILYMMNYLCYHIILRKNHFGTNREPCEMLPGYLSLVCRPGGYWTRMWHYIKSFTVFFFKKKVLAVPVTSKFSYLSHSWRSPLWEIWELYYALIM